MGLWTNRPTRRSLLASVAALSLARPSPLAAETESDVAASK